MKVGFVQVDGSYPNLALMQISAYHEGNGDHVEWYKGRLFDQEYGAVYASKIFSFSEMPDLPQFAKIGGTGINHTNVLPLEIDNQLPSYTLYADCNYHLGFSMKGCRFTEKTCPVCVVPKKEGRPKDYWSLDQILINPNGGNRLMLLDNDFFGGPRWKDNLLQIIDRKLKVCFVQGLNIRIIKPEQAELLAQCKFTNSRFNQRYLTFAWDRMSDERLIFRGIQICNEVGIPSNKMQFFVLIGHDTTHEQNYDRVMRLRAIGAMPFVMPFDKSDPYQKAFTRWVNNRAVFKSCSWDEYKYKITVTP
jgi:hypothetical protein